MENTENLNDLWERTSNNTWLDTSNGETVHAFDFNIDMDQLGNNNYNVPGLETYIKSEIMNTKLNMLSNKLDLKKALNKWKTFTSKT